MIKILHLYYDVMNLYGEYGNITVLCDLLKKNNIEYSLSKYSINDVFDFNDYDFIYCGSGTETKTKFVLEDFMSRKESFIKAFLNNKIILFTGSSFALLGKSLDSKDAMNIFNYDVVQSKIRSSGDYIASCEEFKDIVGFVNTSYSINNSNDAYIKINKCDDSIKAFKNIGFKNNNLLAINGIGPLLVKNPIILKSYYLELIGLSNENIDAVQGASINQEESYIVALDALRNRFNN